MERCASPKRALNAQTPAVRFHHPLGKYQAQPDAARAARSTPVRAEERREEVNHILLGDPDSVIFDRERNVAAQCLRCMKRDCALGVGRVLVSVLQKVVEHPPKENAIDLDRGRPPLTSTARRLVG